MFTQLQTWARRLKKQVFVLYYAYRDDRTPWPAKLIAICVVAYAFSPIDLIPDFIPILGYLDDVILVPLGVMLALRMMPDAVLADAREQAEERMKGGKPKNWFVGALFILIWIAAAVGVVMLFVNR
ncbi:YkvA family protein [Paenibacillus aurantiacus]|uniref:YkvA family protein n=1 Tax=Paenibacillus aurantiacus TaxID=1936118 RepID=A0ABV5KLS6_9BACL